MKKIFLSLPMHDRKSEDIKFTIEKMKNVIKAMYPDDQIEFVDNFNCEYDKIKSVSETEKRLYYLGEAVKKIGECDSFAFIRVNNGLYEYFGTGCWIERDVANRYGIKPIELCDHYGEVYLPDLVEKERKMREEYEAKHGSRPVYGDCAY